MTRKNHAAKESTIELPTIKEKQIRKWEIGMDVVPGSPELEEMGENKFCNNFDGTIVCSRHKSTW
jgi:hypothetical protein